MEDEKSQPRLSERRWDMFDRVVFFFIIVCTQYMGRGRAQSLSNWIKARESSFVRFGEV
jgi:hypothetical protein